MSEQRNIPKHWQLKKLGDIAKWGSGGTPTSTNSSYYGGNIPWLIIGDLNDSYITSSEKTITDLGLKNSSAKIVKPDSVLIAMYGSIGKLGINKIQVATNQAIAFTVRLDDQINNKYLFHFLFHNRSKLHSLGKGGTQKNISQTVLKQVSIPIPPLFEQLAIVSKIEELLSDLENGKQQLQIAQQQLETYRQSLLKWAFEGRFGYAQRPPNNLKDGELPEGWKCVKLGSVLDNIEAGKSFKCDERTPKLNEVGVLKVSAVTWQIFNEIESKTVIEKDRINEAYFVKKDDFLFSRANTLDLIGAVVLVSNIERKLMLSDKTLRFRFSSNILKSYILYYLRSKKGRNEIQRLSTGNQESMRNIGQERIRQIEFPLCSLNEQRLIVEELKSKLTVCDKIEETISQSLQQSEVLRQSILKKAFEGKLVNYGQIE